MCRWLFVVVAVSACGCGRLLGADFEVSEDDGRGVDLGSSCSEPEALHCGPDQLVATCVGGTWSRAFVCPKGEHCEDAPDARCIADDIDCGATKGQRICVAASTSVLCDEQGRVAETSDCPGPCVDDGECLEVEEMALGGSFSCALLSDQSVWCWGLNPYGELGHGKNFGNIDAPVAPARVENLSDVVQIAAGSSFACARRVDGTLYCWGLNVLTGTAVPGFHAVKIPLPSPAVDVGASAMAACARMESHDVYCWGGNDGGQLCSGELTVTAGVVPELTGATAIFMGPRDTCARFDDGSLACCGASDFPGDLSTMGPEFHPILEKVPGIPPIALAALDEGSLCIDAEGSVYCWGGNHFGQLGVGHTAYVDVPSLSFFENGSTLRMGGDKTLALDLEGNLTCCGFACGIPGLPQATTTPFLILPRVEAVAVGVGHTCAVFEGRALCWGMNSDGRINPSLGPGSLIEPMLAGW